MTRRVSESRMRGGALPHSAWGDGIFWSIVCALSGGYALLIVALLLSNVGSVSWGVFLDVLVRPEIRRAAVVSLVSATLSTVLAMWVATPTAYLLARARFRGKGLLDALFDVPLVLPPLVVGVSLLILFRTPAGRLVERVLPVTYELPAIILAQFAVVTALAIRTIRAAFEQIDVRQEQVALTVGCSRRVVFFEIVLPQAWRGVLGAATLAWARALGEFGPVLVFAGATRMKTEVLPTAAFIELSVGNVQAALAISLVMIVAAMLVLGLARRLGVRDV